MAADSLHDLTDRLNARALRADFLAAEIDGSDAALARWARAWGRAVTEVIDDLPDREPLDLTPTEQAILAEIKNSNEGDR